jgi:hypothetical protein
VVDSRFLPCRCNTRLRDTRNRPHRNYVDIRRYCVCSQLPYDISGITVELAECLQTFLLADCRYLPVGTGMVYFTRATHVMPSGGSSADCTLHRPACFLRKLRWILSSLQPTEWVPATSRVGGASAPLSRCLQLIMTKRFKITS